MINFIHKQRNIIVTIIFLIIVFISEYAYSEIMDNSEFKNAYIIVINRLTLTDIENMTNVKLMIDDGGIGLMNTRGANGYEGPQGYITINSSKRAFANYDSGLFFNIDSGTVSSYKRRVGQDLNESQIISAEIITLINLNKDVDFSPAIGALGDNLHNSGYKTAVFGNSDTADSFDRASCLIATDSYGRIDYGNVDQILVSDEDFSHGFRTDYKRLYDEVVNITNKANLIVIETGDLNRLNSYKDKMSQGMYMINRKKVLSKIDEFIGSLTKSIDRDKSLVFIVSPNREESLISDSKLSPIILWGPSIHSGLLTSGSTRRDGLVSNTDIAPTITSFLEASSTNFIGQPMTVKDNKLAFEFIEKLSMDINSTSLIRSKILRAYNILVIIVLLIVLLFLILRKYLRMGYYNIAKYLILSILVMPLVFLIMSLINIKGYFSYIIIALSFVLILDIIIIKLKDRYSLLFLTSIIIITIIIDCIFGGRLIKASVLGYDPIIGARYYGIGNEALGVLLGTTAILLGLFLDLYKKHYYILIILLITIIVVVHPDLGANFGGSIAIIFMSLSFLIQAFNIRINLRTGFSILVITGIVFGCALLFDVFISDNPSHLGKTIRIAIEENPFYIMEMASRKLSMNIRLIDITTWSKSLYFCLFYIFLIVVIFKDIINSLFSKNRFLTVGLISTITGSLTGLLVNDSGIIMASISMIYVTSYLMYATIIEVEKMEQEVIGWTIEH